MKHFIILFVCSVLSVSVQCKAVYKLKVTRAEITRTNKEYVEARVWITKPNRHTNAVNGEFIMYNIPRDTKAKIKMYEFLSNEYRPFAIDLKRDMCQFMVLEYRMMFYPDFLRIGAHMPEPRCPVNPGNYSYFNYVPDVSNFPTTLPFHNFMMETVFWHGEVEMGVVKAYGTFDRDAVIREQYG